MRKTTREPANDIAPRRLDGQECSRTCFRKHEYRAFLRRSEAIRQLLATDEFRSLSSLAGRLVHRDSRCCPIDSAIETGRYKAVNTVGVAVLVAITNALPKLRFPYVFGGDGATVAIPGKYLDEVRYELARTAAWAEDLSILCFESRSFPFRQSAQPATMSVLRDMPHPRTSRTPMFTGGGVAWAETQLKNGEFAIRRAPLDAKPNLSGLYCGFGPIPTEQGIILSIIALPIEEQRSYTALVADVLALIEFSSRGSGHPLPEGGPLPSWLGGEIQRLLSRDSPHANLLTAAADALRAKTRIVLAAGIVWAGSNPSSIDERSGRIRTSGSSMMD